MALNPQQQYALAQAIGYNLYNQIIQATPRKTCGDCKKWMCSSLCPKEQNINGGNKEPSCNQPACNDFEDKETTHNG